MTSSRAGSDDMDVLTKDDTYMLAEGDSFTLCGEQYRFVVRKMQSAQDSKKTPPKKQPSKITPEKKTEKKKAEDSDAWLEEAVVKSEKKKVNGKGKHENDSATIAFGGEDIGNDDDDNNEKNDENGEDDEAIARKLQDSLNDAPTPKSKAKHEDSDEEMARKLQDEEEKTPKKPTPKKDSKKRKADGSDDEVDWASKVKKQKKGKKKGGDDDDEDEDWMATGSSMNTNDDEDEEYVDEDEKPSPGKKKGSPHKKPVCKYGAKCYRQNPDHRKNFSHPK